MKPKATYSVTANASDVGDEGWRVVSTNIKVEAEAKRIAAIVVLPDGLRPVQARWRRARVHKGDAIGPVVFTTKAARF